jgi:hypothetical protein
MVGVVRRWVWVVHTIIAVKKTFIRNAGWAIHRKLNKYGTRIRAISPELVFTPVKACVMMFKGIAFGLQPLAHGGGWVTD